MCSGGTSPFLGGASASVAAVCAGGRLGGGAPPGGVGGSRMALQKEERAEMRMGMEEVRASSQPTAMPQPGKSYEAEADLRTDSSVRRRRHVVMTTL